MALRIVTEATVGALCKGMTLVTGLVYHRLVSGWERCQRRLAMPELNLFEDDELGAAVRGAIQRGDLEALGRLLSETRGSRARRSRGARADGTGSGRVSVCDVAASRTLRP
jgi:hypothetical protein